MKEELPISTVNRTLRPSGMKVVNAHLANSIRDQGMLQDPNSFGYVKLALEFERPRLFFRNSARKRTLLKKLKAAAAQLVAAKPEVRRTDVFDAMFIPPGSAEGRMVLANGKHDVHVAKFDIVILVECNGVSEARRVRESKNFCEMKGLADEAAEFVYCTTARNPKRIAEVDKDRDGVFLFNYFFRADDGPEQDARGTEILLAVWEYTAGWWTEKANLTNSTPLLPLDDQSSQYSLINHCRWDSLLDVLPSLIFRPSMGKFVLSNFTANNIVAMPILYRLA